MSTRSFPFMVDAMLAMQNFRIAAQVRNSHLARNQEHDPDTQAILDKMNDVEEFIEKRVAEMLAHHPAYPWFSRVKGIGNENIAKIVGLVDINRAPTISSLWKYAGYHVVDGKGAKKTKGQKLEYNATLRTMCWRVAGSLMKVTGKYRDFYDVQKAKIQEDMARRGIKIVPAAQLPKKDGKTYEPEGMISEGHVHNRALRKMIKLFLAHLWLVWRSAEGLPIREPYVHEKMGHTTIIDPWEMVDKPEKKRRKAKMAVAVA